MRFGLYVMPQHPMEDPPYQRFREALLLARLAREAGFDGIACGQHFLSPPYQNLQSIPLLARLAAEAEGLHLCLGVLLLPLYNPVDVAETVASLDIISGGKVIFGVGLGYREVEYEAFGVRPGERTTRFEEALEVVRLLWAQEEVTYEGRFIHLKGAVCTIRPLQRPHPPIWVAANNDPAIRRAARLGLPWLINPHATLSTIERQVAVYQEEARRAGRTPPGEVPVLRELFVAPTREEAVRTARPYLEAKYRSYSQWGQDKALPGQESFQVPFDDLARDRFLLGSPEEVVEQIDALHRRTGATYLLVRVWWPGMEASQAYRAVALMGERVIPEVRRRLGRTG